MIYAFFLFLDVIGICVRTSPIEDKITKIGNRSVKKIDVYLADTSAETKLTLWAQQAENFKGKVGEVVMVKGAKISTFDGKYLKMAAGSSLQISPDLPETSTLISWFESRRSISSEGNKQRHNSMDPPARW